MNLPNLTDGIDPCPCCGGSSFTVGSNTSYGTIKCNGCDLYMRCDTIPEHYVQIDGDIYRKIPVKYGLAVAKERWNRRVTNGE